MGDDWRIMNQEKTLAGRPFLWVVWTSFRLLWDHDRCEFCQAEFAAKASDHSTSTIG